MRCSQGLIVHEKKHMAEMTVYPFFVGYTDVAHVSSTEKKIQQISLLDSVHKTAGASNLKAAQRKEVLLLKTIQMRS